MKITVIGTGYVGLVVGACLAEYGNEVLCFDTDEGRIRFLEDGKIPIFEPGLPELVRYNVAAGRLHFTADVDHAVEHGTLQFIAVGTPPDEDGAADLRFVLRAARNIGTRMADYKVVIGKSTVPVGTGDKLRAVIAEELDARGVAIPYSVVSNPEFLREGTAIEDFLRPDRIIVGAEDEHAIRLMRTLYAPFQHIHERILVMDVKSAELTKYAANAMLATRISFMNELGNLAEKLGADIEMVRQGIAHDPRIGRHFLNCGCGYGGSCFPKDIKALIATSNEYGQPLKILTAVEQVNDKQKCILCDKVKTRFGNDLKGRHFALWGLAFKPDTDDMREAPSLSVVAGLVAAGATVSAYDPAAMSEARRVYSGQMEVSFCENAVAVCDKADALIIVTEWKEFRNPDFNAMKTALKSPVIFDGRNLYAPDFIRNQGFEYFAIGR